MTDTTYNGWANYETWNVSLWLGNDEGLYNLIRRCDSYKEVVFALLDCDITETGDGVNYNDVNIDENEMNEFISEL